MVRTNNQVFSRDEIEILFSRFSSFSRQVLQSALWNVIHSREIHWLWSTDAFFTFRIIKVAFYQISLKKIDAKVNLTLFFSPLERWTNFHDWVELSSSELTKEIVSSRLFDLDEIHSSKKFQCSRHQIKEIVFCEDRLSFSSFCAKGKSLSVNSFVLTASALLKRL